MIFFPAEIKDFDLLYIKSLIKKNLPDDKKPFFSKYNPLTGESERSLKARLFSYKIKITLHE